jgi:hypothetical protein
MSGTTAPRLLLSLRSLHGPTLATRDRLLEVRARYREPESLAVTLAKAVGVPVDGVLSGATPMLRAALAELNLTVPLFVLVPAMTEYQRQELAPGLEAAIDAGVKRARLGARLRLGLSGALRFGGRDFVGRIPVLVEAEIAGLPRRSIRGVVLDAWFTDLALAAGNRKLFESYPRFVRRRFKAAAGFETRNLGTLLARLREWQLKPDFVVGPLNPSGLLMKPSAEELLAEVRRSEVPVVARELCAGGVDAMDEAVRYAREHGAYGLAPDLAEMDDVGAELRAMSRSHSASEQAVEVRS